jgi:adenylate cyclase, class 2
VLETEIKFRAADLGLVRSRLLEMGAVLVRERHREDNRLYDFREGTLAAGRSALRLRTAGRRATLTFKGQPQASRRFKIRPEYETAVSDAAAVSRILKGLGLRPVFRYVKQRTELRLGRVHVCLDELVIGTFVELEGPRPHIARLARKMSVPSGEWITSGYPQLLVAAGYLKGAAHSSSRSAAPGSSGSSSSSPSSSPSASSS